MDPLRKFSLPLGGTELYGNGVQLLNSQFVGQVHDFHIDRLPRYEASVAGSICAYCGKLKDRRSLRLDHIIPVKAWCCWQIRDVPWQVRDEKKATGAKVVKSGKAPQSGNRKTSNSTKAVYLSKDDIDLEKKIQIKLDEECVKAFQNDDNLILCCMKCNAGKGNKQPDELGPDRRHKQYVGELKNRTYFDRAEEFLKESDAISIIQNCKNIMKDIRKYDALNFILHQQLGSYSISQEDQNYIKNVIVRRLVGSRPNINLSDKVFKLMQKQSPKRGDTKKLRLCLYCLGLYQKQAFALDHIRPVMRSATKPAPSAKDYNDPENIVAVCSSCNSAKSSQKLTLDFIKGRIKIRKLNEDLGLESVLTRAAVDDLGELTRIFKL